MARKSFNNAIMSDITIQLRGGDTVYADRRTLCRSSERFQTLLQDSNVELIALNDDNPTAMKAVLGFLHGIPHPDCMLKLLGSSSLSWTYYAKVYKTAVKYDIESLAKDILDELDTLKLPRFENFLDFFKAVRVAFSTSIDAYSRLRSLLARRCMRRIPKHPRLNDHPEFGAILRKYPKFTEMMFGEVEDKRVFSIMVTDSDGGETTVRGTLSATMYDVFEVTAGHHFDGDDPCEVLLWYKEGQPTHMKKRDWYTPLAELAGAESEDTVRGALILSCPFSNSCLTRQEDRTIVLEESLDETDTESESDGSL